MERYAKWVMYWKMQGGKTVAVLSGSKNFRTFVRF
jgi:hypothetical protein